MQGEMVLVKKRGYKPTPFQLYLDFEVLGLIKEVADQEEISASLWIRMAIDEKMKRDHPEKALA